MRHARIDPPVLVARPHELVRAVHRDAERWRRGHGFRERRGLLVSPARPRDAPGEQLVEAPHPNPGLSPCPQLAKLRLARERPQEGAHLRLPRRVGSHLERRRAARVHGRAKRHAEDALAPARSDELRQRTPATRAPVLRRRHGPLQRHRAGAGAADGSSV